MSEYIHSVFPLVIASTASCCFWIWGPYASVTDFSASRSSSSFFVARPVAIRFWSVIERRKFSSLTNAAVAASELAAALVLASSTFSKSLEST